MDGLICVFLRIMWCPLQGVDVACSCDVVRASDVMRAWDLEGEFQVKAGAVAAVDVFINFLLIHPHEAMSYLDFLGVLPTENQRHMEAEERQQNRGKS